MVLHMDAFKWKIIIVEKVIIHDDTSKRTEVDKRVLKEVGANLRLIADQWHAEYTQLSFRNLFLWIRITGVLKRFWL